MSKRQMTQRHIAQFKEAREEWKRREERRMEEENRRIMVYANMQKERDLSQDRAKEEREMAMGKVQQAVSRFGRSRSVMA